MSDYRNLNDPYANDPARRDLGYDPDTRTMNAAWGWIAAALFVVIVLAVAFGIGRQPNAGDTNTAANDTTPPAATRMAPPANPAPLAATPTLPAATPAPVTPAPAAPQGAQ